MEGFEQAGTLCVEATEIEITELSTQLIGQDEPGVDNLTLLAVTECFSIFGPSHRILYGTEVLGDRSQIGVIQGRGLSEAKDGMVGQGSAQRRTECVIVCTCTVGGSAQHLRGTEAAWQVGDLNVRRYVVHLRRRVSQRRAEGHRRIGT